MILQPAKHGQHKPNSNNTSNLANKEWGEWLLHPVCQPTIKVHEFTVRGTEEYLNNNSPYYSGGNKVVEIPALVNDVIDTIFPEISGAI